MAGISAASASKTHAVSTADATATGFVTGEQVTLATSPTGASYQWSIAIPSDSAPSRSALDDDTDAAPKFTPDVPGYYTITCVVAGSTTYVLRLAVGANAFVRVGEGHQFIPLTDAQIPTPQVGFTLYCGSEHGDLPCIKKADGTVHTVDLTAV